MSRAALHALSLKRLYSWTMRRGIRYEPVPGHRCKQKNSPRPHRTGGFGVQRWFWSTACLVHFEQGPSSAQELMIACEALSSRRAKKTPRVCSSPISRKLSELALLTSLSARFSSKVSTCGPRSCPDATPTSLRRSRPWSLLCNRSQDREGKVLRCTSSRSSVCSVD